SVAALTAALRVAPLHEVLEQLLAILRRGVRPLRRNEALELIALRLRGLRLPLQPFVGALEAGPAGQRRREIGFLPLRMARRLLEFSKFREEVVDEQMNPAIAIRAFRPVVGAPPGA